MVYFKLYIRYWLFAWVMSVACIAQVRADCAAQVPITATNSSGSALADHTLELFLTSSDLPSFDWSGNALDVKVTDASFTTNFDFWVESVDPVAQTLQLWIQVPSIPANASVDAAFLYRCNDPVSSDIAATFAQQGFKFQSQPYSANQDVINNRSDGDAVFDYASVSDVSGYGCTSIPDLINRDNSGTFGSNRDIAYYNETFIQLDTTGTYQFRYGGDFGHGGEISIGDTAYTSTQGGSSSWTTDIWWAFNFNHPDVMLTPPVNLNAGIHHFDTLAFERCCDGAARMQFRRTDGGQPNSWSDLTTTSPGVTLYAPSCPVATISVAQATTPVTLSHFDSDAVGTKIQIDWGTSSELFNVGFQLWGLDGVDQRWEKLNGWLIRSGSGNSVEPQSYSKTVTLPGSISELVALGISSVDSDGSEHYYGPFSVYQAYGDLSALKPIAWNHIRDQVDAQMTARGYVKHRVNGYRKVMTTSSATANDAETVMELAVRETGMYRITAQSLLKAGMDLSGTSKRDIALINPGGKAVVRYVLAKGAGSGQNKTLGETGEIYFYSPGVDAREGLYSETRVYRLVMDSSRALDGQFQGRQGVTTGLSNSYMETAYLENDNQYMLSSLADDPWVDAVMVSYPDRTAAYAAAIPVEGDALWSRPGSMTMKLGRSSTLRAVDLDDDGNVDPEHLLEAVVLSSQSTTGLMSLGRQQARGAGAWQVEFKIPAHTPLSIIDGKVVIGGIFRAGTGYAFSEVHVDAASISYARPTTAKAGDDYLMFTGQKNSETGYAVTVPDTGWPMVFAFNEHGALVRLALESQTRLSHSDGSRQRTVTLASLNGSAADPSVVRYWVSGKGGFRQVESLSLKSISTPSTLLSQAVGSNYLIIAHPMFMGSGSDGTDLLSSYAAFKRSQGYRVSIIDYLQIVEVFGGGQPGPLGLTKYLEAVNTSYEQLEHVLLVGGSSYDHTDKLGIGAMTFIPGHYSESDYSNYTVSDAPYIMDRANGLFAGIGRWPVRSLTELQTIVDKSIAWGNQDHNGGDALLIAENKLTNEQTDFGDALDGVAKQLPLSWRKNRVYVDDIAKANPSFNLTQALAQAKDEIIDQLNKGADVVIYNGHASTRQLSNKGLFKAADVSRLKVADPQLWLPLSCYMTYYESTHVDTLPYQLLFNGSAVAISGAMLLSDQARNIAAGTAILDSTLNRGMRMGEAVNAHKLIRGNDSLSINWALLGDPTVGF